MSRGGNLVKNTIIISIGNFLPKLASFITLPILTAYLTKSEYGTYDLITVLASLLLPAITLQIQAAAFRFLVVSRKNDEEKKKIITDIYAFILPISILSVIVLFFVLWKISPAIRSWICVYFFAECFAVNARQIARGFGRNKDYSLSAIISTFIRMGLVVFLVKGIQKGLLGAVIALAISETISYFFIAAKIHLFSYINRSSFDKRYLMEMLQYSWPIVPSEISMWIMQMSDRLVISIFLGLAANGVYAVANKIPSLINLAQGAFTLAWQENATIAVNDNDAAQYYSDMFSVIYRILGGFFGCVIASMPILFKILIKGEYSEAYQQMPILCLAVFFAGVATYFGGIYIAYKNSKSVGITTLVAAGVNLFVDFLLIRHVGLYAASVSTLVSYVVLCIYRMIDVKKMVIIKYDNKLIWTINGIMIAECVLCFLQKPFFSIINICIAVFAAVFFNYDFINKVTKYLGKKMH